MVWKRKLKAQDKTVTPDQMLQARTPNSLTEFLSQKCELQSKLSPALLSSLSSSSKVINDTEKVLNLIMDWRSRKDLEKPEMDGKLWVDIKLVELHSNFQAYKLIQIHMNGTMLWSSEVKDKRRFVGNVSERLKVQHNEYTY